LHKNVGQVLGGKVGTHGTLAQVTHIEFGAHAVGLAVAAPPATAVRVGSSRLRRVSRLRVNLFIPFFICISLYAEASVCLEIKTHF
jgi:hypothetical protein